MQLPITLKRSSSVLIALIVCLIPGIIEWKSALSGAYATHHHGYWDVGAHTWGLLIPFAVLPAMAYDCYLRFVRRARLTFSEVGIGDYASLSRLGNISWNEVQSVTLKRVLLGTTVTVKFKKSARIGGRLPDILSIDSMRVRAKEAAAIDTLLSAHNLD